MIIEGRDPSLPHGHETTALVLVRLINLRHQRCCGGFGASALDFPPQPLPIGIIPASRTASASRGTLGATTLPKAAPGIPRFSSIRFQ